MLSFTIVLSSLGFAQQTEINIETIAPGVIKMSMGVPDKFAPYTFCSEKPKEEQMEQLSNTPLPFDLKDVRIYKNSRGVQVCIPLNDEEQLYGFGMQIGTFEQRGLRKQPIVNDYPINAIANDNPITDIGFTHAPQPFYVSTSGYGVLVNTSRYITFLCGTNQELIQQDLDANKEDKLKFSPDELYENQLKENLSMWIDVPSSEGVELFFFQGNTIKESVQRYNLFSGGGAMPPLWGLGVKYRVKGDFQQDDVIDMASYFREHQIPCDVLGLEPGWHTKAYSCSYVWSDKFPRSQEMINELKEMNFKLNLWEHAYVNPAAPFYKDLEKKSGSFLVWNGLVPDFADPKAASIFADYHEKNFVDKGIASFKLDECDNSNIIDAKATWGFPDMTQFPSGIDGEQMHQVFGSLYANTLFKIYKDKNIRTYFDYRSSNVFTSSLPAVLYSDIYEHDNYISMISTAAFGGLLWSPELRHAQSETDFIRRLQTMLLAPQAVVNAWYLKNVPWFQLNVDKNNADLQHENADELESLVRILFKERMSLIPYIYAAFSDYSDKGIPPFRPLIMDYPTDKHVRNIADQFMIGKNLMATPTTMDSNSRSVYFPEGIWYDYNTHEKYEGMKTYTIDITTSKLPLFVKSGSIVPVAVPVDYIADDTKFEITGKVFGDSPAPFTLLEDDGISYDFEKGKSNNFVLSVANGKGVVKRNGNFKNTRYKVTDWEFIK